MANVMRLRYADADHVMCPVDSDTVIEIGDFVYLDTDDAKPASSQADNGTESLNQAAIRLVFLGVAMQQSRSGDTDDIRIATRGVFEYPCPSGTFELGALIGIDEASGGTALEDQQVASVATANLAIARVAKRQGTAATTVWIEVRSTILQQITDTSGFLTPTSFADDAEIVFGTGSDAVIGWETGDASDHSLVIGLGDTSQMLHITDKAAIGSDWGITSPTHPTVYIHSNTTPITDYLSIGGHDGTTAALNLVGGTTLDFRIAGNDVVVMTATAFTFVATCFPVLPITDTDGTVEGSIWYDASEDKLKFKTAAGVETITST